MKDYLKFDYNSFNNRKIKEILTKFGKKDPKILYLSTYDPHYVRTETLINTFKRNKINYKLILTGESKFKYFKLIQGLIRHQNDYDVIFVAFRGHEILPFIKILTSKPIIFDSFVSIYDTLCDDRKIFNKSSIIGKILRWYDRLLCNISSLVLVDTKAHQDYYKKQFNVSNVDYLYVGCNENLFKKINVKRPQRGIVFWYGHANPLQGVDVILKTASLTKNKNVLFRLVGPIRKKYADLIKKLNLNNVEFVDFIPYKELPVEINRSHICLGGHFSNIDKAKRVIAGKTYQFLACDKVTIVGDNPANRELFKESSKLKFVEMNSPASLAKKILEVIDHG